MSLFSLTANFMAGNASRQLSAHYAALSDSVRHMASGLRVQQAADDAAGLAIRELMRGDMAALGQGARNANDAISLIQTADGALAIIDEKLIRMKELAEQAATGTYDSTQRLIINSEFQQMALEIDRIANSTEFNGVKLLDGSLSGRHAGSGAGSADGLSSVGALKVHFGTANDSAEDYYYVSIGDCTLAGLGLGAPPAAAENADADTGDGTAIRRWEGTLADSGMQIPTLMDGGEFSPQKLSMPWNSGADASGSWTRIPTAMSDLVSSGGWYFPLTAVNMPYANGTFFIPKGTKNIALVTYGSSAGTTLGDNDIELFALEDLSGTRYGDWTLTHLAGTPINSDVAPWEHAGYTQNGYLDAWGTMRLNEKFVDRSSCDESNMNTGPAAYDPTGNTLSYLEYKGMTIGYSGDPDQYDSTPNDGILQDWPDYEILTIDEAKMDLLVGLPGFAGISFKIYWNLPDAPAGGGAGGGMENVAISVSTQELAQQALTRLDEAIIRKDKVRAHLGALQNRLENTVTNLTIQGENLQSAESRISDADVAAEMMTFVRNQVLTRSATAMLSQANTFPHMLLQLLQE